MRTARSAPRIEVLRLVLPDVSLLLLGFPLFFQRLAGLLSRRLLRGSVRHVVSIHTSSSLHGSFVGMRFEGGEKFAERDGRHADGGVADSVRYGQGTCMEERAAGVDDVWHIPVLFVRSRAEEGLTEPADDPGRVLNVKQHGPDAVGAHGSHTVR